MEDNVEKSYNIKSEIRKCHEKINYLQRMLNLSYCYYQRVYYNELLKYETDKLKNLINYKNLKLNNLDEREFTLEELAKYDGSNGDPAYVAVDGIVYDVSLDATWGGGTHFGLYAGKDLTNQFNGCHGNKEILENLPKVGVLKE